MTWRRTVRAHWRRDVREETEIEVGAVHYHQSQPWPFPANIILGLHARGLTTEMTVDYGELEDAGSCERDWLLSHKDGDTLSGSIRSPAD
jgi:NADH pyrophosphatase NudC (nudix superfamily)